MVVTLLLVLQVAVVSFKRGQLKVLSLEWDRNLGGKDFDEVLFSHFVEEFDAKYKLDIRSNKRASFRLRLAVEKVQFSAHCMQKSTWAHASTVKLDSNYRDPGSKLSILLEPSMHAQTASRYKRLVYFTANHMSTQEASLVNASLC